MPLFELGIPNPSKFDYTPPSQKDGVRRSIDAVVKPFVSPDEQETYDRGIWTDTISPKKISYTMSPTDRDLLIRTVIGEAGDQSPTGQAAVAYSVLNRLADGGYGRTPGAVMLAPNQYEPWSTRAAELTSIPTNSRAYKQVSTLVDDVLAGKVADPTEGATHFLNPVIVRQRRGGSLPDWAQGPGVQIGENTFFNPRGQATAFAANDKQPIPDILGEFINAAPKAQTTQAPAQAVQANEPPDVLGEYLKAAQEAPKAQPAAAVKSAGVPDNGIGPPKAPEMMTPLEKKGEEESIALGKANSNKGILDKAAEAVGTVGSDYVSRLSQLAGENAGVVGQGMQDVAAGKSATGVGEIGLGALGYLFSPAGAVDVPIAKMTGNKEFGEKAALLMPGGVGGKVANEARPAVSAVKDIIKDVGKENIPQVVKRLESNPNLTLMDVAPAVRGNAAGLATDPRNVPAMTQLTEFQKARMANRPAAQTEAFEGALGPTPNAKETVDALKTQAQQTGKQLIEPSIASAAPVDVTPIIADIDKKFPPTMLKDLKAGKEPPAMPDESKRLWALRERLRGDTPEGSPVTVAPQTAHDLQVELRLQSGDPRTGYDARSIRRGLVNAIDNATAKPAVTDEAGAVVSPAQPGTYKAALKQYAGDKQVEDAFQKGYDLFSNPTSAEKSLSNHPDMWKAWASDASKAELDAAKKGAMLGAHTRIMNMRKGVDVPEGSFAHERLAAIVGDKEANKIVQTLNDWRDISETDNLLLKNSATAIRQAGQEARSVRDPKSGQDILQKMMPAAVVGGMTHLAGGQNPILSGLTAAGVLAGGKAANKLGRMHDIASNRAYAQWAAATGPQRESLIDVLKAASRKSAPGSKAQKLIDLVPTPLLQALPQ